MELLCGVPKPLRSSKYDNWGTWGKMGFAPSTNGDPYLGRSSTMPSKFTGEFRRSSRTSSFHIRQHLLPTEEEKCKPEECSGNDTYQTLFSIPETKDSGARSGELADKVTSPLLPFRRTRTLPISATRRSGATIIPTQKTDHRDFSHSRGALYSPPNDAPSLRSLKDKFKVESFRRYNKNKSKKIDFDAKFEDSSKNIYTIPRNINHQSYRVDGPVLAFKRNLSMPPVNMNEAKRNGQLLRIPSEFSLNSDDNTLDNIVEEKQLSQSNAYSGENKDTRGVVRLSHYKEANNVDNNESNEDKKLIFDSLSSNSNHVFPEMTNKITDDLLTDILAMEGFPSKGLTDTFENIISESFPTNLYSEPLPTKDELQKEEESSDVSERNSLLSSASVGSRLTFGTSTDEGIGSIYSETYSSLWSSSASSGASTCSTRCVGKYNAYPTTDEVMSVYSGMSSASSFASSLSSSSSRYSSKGAIPKMRSASFRRYRERDYLRSQCCSDAISESELCSQCKKDPDEEVRFKRGGSLRAPKQLPVTPTLLRLLQLGLEQVGGVGSNSSLNGDVDSGIANGVGVVVRREKKLHPPRTDPHRLSRANLEQSGDLELDAILSELCALENKFNFEIGTSSSTKPPPENLPVTSTTSSSTTSSSTTSSSTIAPPSNHLNGGATMPSEMIMNGSNSHRTTVQSANMHKTEAQQMNRPPKFDAKNVPGCGYKNKYDSINIEIVNEHPSTLVTRTHSPDNDSAFSDNVSMLSSESSASSGASAGGVVSSSKQGTHKHPNTMDQAAKAKAEKIKMALEKLKEANVKKLFIKAFSNDGSSKSLLVDEKMSVSQVCRMLTDKNHVRVDPKWALIEHLPDLYMERIYEDDEMLVDNLLLWTRDSKNRLLFLERPDKYHLFFHPEDYLLYGTTQHKSDIDDEARTNLLEEFFSSSRVPEVEGPLFLKSEGKKAWKKFYFVLRQSGLYYCPKGKSSRSSKDLICLATLDNNQVYHGFGWKKKFKAPTDWGFALKFPHLQAKSSKHIKYLCSENPEALKQWVMGIRIAKNGHRLLYNYRALVEEIAQEDIDLLASSRSFSLASVSANSRVPSEATTPSSESRSLDSCLAPSLTISLQEEEGDDACSSTGSSSQDTPVNTLCRAPAWRYDSFRSNSSSSSSGCLSERSSSTGTPPTEGGFEADFPQQGTIKRKPSSNPKLPLTSTTRHLVKEVDVNEGGELTPRTGSLRRSTRKTISEEVSTLRRRNNSSSTLGRASITSNISSTVSAEEDVVDSYPLPPPPNDMGGCDPELLPPPPPELLASTLSLNSFPPPPDEASMPSLSGEDMMTASITSLPPPPPPQILPKPSTPNVKYSPSPPATPPKPKLLFNGPPLSPPATAPKPQFVTTDPIYASRGRHPSADPQPPPIYDNRLELHSSPPVPNPPPSIYVNPQKSSPQKRVKKITFREEVQRFPISPCPSPPGSGSPSKCPLPPRRLPSTRLSLNPGKLASPGCKVTPPKSFLNNLQKVMQKKWQVAQKCRDFDKTPHEVLGFRDPVPQVEAERNVGAWIQEHYGSLYENLAPISTNGVEAGDTVAGHYSGEAPIQPHLQTPSETIYADRCIIQTVSSVKKKPPPPPPKRAETTHLSTRS